MIVAKSTEWAFLLLQGNLVLIVWREICLCSFWEIWWSKCDFLHKRGTISFSFFLNETFTKKEGGWFLGLEFEFTYYIVPTFFYISVLGNKMGCGYFCLKLLHTIVASKFGTRIIIMSYIWGWDLRTLLPIFKVDWKQTWCLFC